MEKKIKINDKSGDRQFFTIVPRIVLRSLNVYDRCTYIAIKDIAGEDGTCWMSERNLSLAAQISRGQIHKSLMSLLEKGFIEKVGTREGKTKPSVEYAITNVWERNIAYSMEKKDCSLYEQSTEIAHPMTGIAHPVSKDCSPRGPKEEDVKKIKEEDIAAVAAEWTYERALEKMTNDPRPDIRIIAMYYRTKGLRYDSSAQLTAAIKRDLRAAGALKTYRPERIMKVLVWLKENADFKYTLESAHKYIDENLAVLGRAPQVVKI